MAILTSLGTVITQVIAWFAEIITAIFSAEGSLNALMPLALIGIASSLVFLGVRVFRKIAWGN